MPAKRCIETKNMRLLFVDYCIFSFLYPVSFFLWVLASFFLSCTQFLFFLWVPASFYPVSRFSLGTGVIFSFLYPFSLFPLGTGFFFSSLYPFSLFPLGNRITDIFLLCVLALFLSCRYLKNCSISLSVNKIC